MFKEGDIVVIEDVGSESGWYETGLEGSIVQLRSTIYINRTTIDANIYALFVTTPVRVPLVALCNIIVRKIDRPLKFRGGKVINVEEATSPF